MSLLSQFYPRGGSASGFIRAEVFIASGGGGGGGGGTGPLAPGNEATGSGGGGGVFYGYVALAPGSTNPITVGGGGAGGPVGAFAGSSGSPSSLQTATGTINVAGGGGGGGWNPGPIGVPGRPGGCGGGAGYVGPYGGPSGPAGFSQYAAPHGSKWGSYPSTDQGNSGSLIFGDGRFFGTPGSAGAGAPINIGGAGGNSLGARGFETDISGTQTTYCTAGGIRAANTGPANSGDGGGSGIWALPAGGAGAAGGSGVVIVKYPTQFAAAPSFPGATDLSPSTPGFRTYRFTSPGSITLP